MLGVNVKQRCSKGVARLTTSLGMGDAGRGQEGERELHAVDKARRSWSGLLAI